MKKTWTMAILAAGMMASCSSNGEEAPSVTEQEEAPVKMELSVGPLASVSVAEGRGTGSVGGTGNGEDKNLWAGQTINVFAIGTDAQTIDAEGNPKKTVAFNLTATAPDQVTAGNDNDKALTLDDIEQYYNGTYIYNFYGYHFDGATTTNPAANSEGKFDITPDLETSGLSTDIEIDGTQDIMLATTDKAMDIAGTQAATDGDVSKLYSAWSARRNVTPTLNFKHLLSRFTFTALLGEDPDDSNPLSITAIKIVNAKTKGTVTILPADAQGLEVDPTDTGTELELKQRNSENTDLVALDPIVINSNSDPIKLGESMLLMPSESYNIAITVEQRTIAAATQEPITKTISIDDDGFLGGKSYNVAIKVYGLKRIEVNATLTAWGEGGTIDVDPDDM